MKRGFRKIKGCDDCPSNRNLGLTLTGGSLRLDARLVPVQKDEQTPLGTGMLNHDSHQLLNQTAKDNFTGERLRGLDYCLDVQLPDRRADSGRGKGGSSFLAEARVERIKLLHLAQCAPALVAVPGVAQICVGNRLEAAGAVESRGNLMRQRLVLYEAVFASRCNGLLVQVHRVGVSPFEASDLGQNQGVLVGEGRRIVFGPLAQLFPMRRQEFAPLLLPAVRSVPIACRRRQRSVVKVVEQLNLGGCSKKKRLGLAGCRESRSEIAG